MRAFIRAPVEIWVRPKQKKSALKARSILNPTKDQELEQLIALFGRRKEGGNLDYFARNVMVRWNEGAPPHGLPR